MFTTRRISAAILIAVLTLTTVPTTSAAIPAFVPMPSTQRVQGGTASQHRAVTEAIELYRDLGRGLPTLSVQIHPDKEACDGHGGMFRYSGSNLHIDFCSDQRYVILHELGHAWVHANVSDTDQDRYTDYRDLPTWNDWSYEWGQRAAEDAAFVLQQNLMADAPVRSSNRWLNLIDAFEMLTKTESPVQLY